MRANDIYDSDDYSEAQKLGPDLWLGLPSFPLALSVHQTGHCQAGLNPALRQRPGLLRDGWEGWCGSRGPGVPMELMIRVHEARECRAGRRCRQDLPWGQLFLHLNHVVLHWLKWLEGDLGYEEKDDVATPAQTSGVGGRDKAEGHGYSPGQGPYPTPR